MGTKLLVAFAAVAVLAIPVAAADITATVTDPTSGSTLASKSISTSDASCRESLGNATQSALPQCKLNF